MDINALIAALDPSHKRWQERRFWAARTIDIIARKDGVEYRYEGDFLKDVARALAPKYQGIDILTDADLPNGVVRIEKRTDR